MQPAPDLVILDCGIGNLRSVHKAFLHEGVHAVLSRDPGRIAAASHLVLPGVGAFGDFLAALDERGLREPLLSQLERGVPLLGICVGMQVLYEESDEFGTHEGLGLLPGRIERFSERELPVPHSGWNQARPCREDPLFAGLGRAPWFYFVHSFRVAPEGEGEHSLAQCDYGGRFTAACRRGAICGVQFHPEKSQRAGLRLLHNFAGLPSPALGAQGC